MGNRPIGLVFVVYKPSLKCGYRKHSYRPNGPMVMFLGAIAAF